MNQIEIYLKLFKNMKFSDIHFSQWKKVGLRLFTITMIFKMVLNEM